MNIISPTWPTYKNDVFEDCYCAAAGHLIKFLTGSEPSEAMIITAFQEITGGQDIPEPERRVLDYWRDTGIAGHRIDGWKLIDHRDHDKVRRHIHAHGIYAVLDLPDGGAGDMVWYRLGGGRKGHYVAVVDVSTLGPICVTWGRFQQMTWEFWDACVITAASIHMERTAISVTDNNYREAMAILREQRSTVSLIENVSRRLDIGLPDAVALYYRMKAEGVLIKVPPGRWVINPEKTDV